MTRRSRYWVNAAICALVVAHAVYRFVTRPEVASEIWLGLVVAQGVLGLFGAAWFARRARGAAA